MNYERICYGCFREKSGTVCPYCGFNPEAHEHPFLALPIGTILAGRYLTGKVLGMGGFGITYLGFDMTLEIKVAIKEYMPSGIATRHTDHYSLSLVSTNDEGSYNSGVDRFLDEARILAKLKDVPNIVSVQNYFKENNTAYFVMDYVDGVSLKEFVARQGGRIPFEQAKTILLPVMESLSQVHAQSLLHRDISPDNIYITSSGQSRLLDFGAARFALGNDKSMSVILKHGYAPEEQYRTHGNQGPWTDVYAMGATFYNCITGTLPPDSIDRLHEDTLIPPAQLGVDLPQYASDALMRAMAVKSSDRFTNMAEFIGALIGRSGGTVSIPLPTAPGAPAGATVAASASYQPQYAPQYQSQYQPQPGVQQPAKPGFFQRLKTDTKLLAIVVSAATLVVAAAILVPILLLNKNNAGSSSTTGSGKLPPVTQALETPAPVPEVPAGYLVYSDEEGNYSFYYNAYFNCVYEPETGAVIYTEDADFLPYVTVSRSYVTNMSSEDFFADQLRTLQLQNLPELSAEPMTQYVSGTKTLDSVTYSYIVDASSIKLFSCIEILGDSIVNYTVKWIDGYYTDDLDAALNDAIYSFQPNAHAYDGAAIVTPEPAASQTYTHQSMAFSLELPTGGDISEYDEGVAVLYNDELEILCLYFDNYEDVSCIYDANDFYYQAYETDGWLETVLGVTDAGIGDPSEVTMNGAYGLKTDIELFVNDIYASGEMFMFDGYGTYGVYVLIYAVDLTATDSTLYQTGLDICNSFTINAMPTYVPYYTSDFDYTIGYQVLYSPENILGDITELDDGGKTYFLSPSDDDKAEITIETLDDDTFGTSIEDIFDNQLKFYRKSAPDLTITGGDYYYEGLGRFEWYTREYTITDGVDTLWMMTRIARIYDTTWSINMLTDSANQAQADALAREFLMSFRLLAD
jgi:serine/threonine protein kinase